MSLLSDYSKGTLLTQPIALGRSKKSSDPRSAVDNISEFEEALNELDIELRYDGLITFERTTGIIYVFRLVDGVWIARNIFENYYTKEEVDAIVAGIRGESGVSSVTIVNAQTTVKIGDTLQLVAEVLPTTLSNREVTWSSSNNDFATVTSTGLLTAVAEGDVTITATSKLDTTKKATKVISIVADEVYATSIALNKSTTTVLTNKTETLIATVEPNNCTQAIEWSTSNDAVATVDQNGKITALTTGDAVITAKVKKNATGYVSAVCSVNVFPSTDSIAISDAVERIAVGVATPLQTVIEPEMAYVQSVTWSVDDTTIATINPTTGVITGKKNGNVTVTITQDELRASKVIEVYTAVSSVTLNETSITNAIVGGQVQLAATVLPNTASDKSVSWSTSDDTKATVSNTGLVKYVAEGDVTITATANDGSNKKGTCTIAISKPENKIVSVSLGENKSLMVDDTLTLSPVVTLDNGTSGEIMGDGSSLDSSILVDSVTFSSSQPDVATVDQTGNVTAIKAGTTTITCTVDGEISTTVDITVTATSVPCTSVTITSAGNITSIEEGQTLQLTSTALPENTTDQLGEWIVETPTVGTVSIGGLFTALSQGSTVVKRVCGTQTGQITITVTAATITVSSVTVTPNTGSISNTNPNLQLTATVLPSEVTNKDVTWSTDKTNVATVSQSGLVTYVGAGTCTITATSKADTTKKGTCTITATTEATQIDVTGINLNMSSISLTPANSPVQLTAEVLPSTATNKNVTWSSDNGSVATVTDGLVSYVGNGSCIITCTSVSNPDVTATCSVFCSEVSTGVEFYPRLSEANANMDISNLTMGVGKKMLVNIDTFPTTETALEQSGFTFTSTDSTVATMATYGNTYRLSALKVGNATITIAHSSVEGYQRVLNITVTEEALPQRIFWNSNQQYQVILSSVSSYTSLAARVAPYEGVTDNTVTYASSDENVFTVDASTGAITVVGVGDAILTATSNGNPNLSITMPIYIVDSMIQAKDITAITTDVDSITVNKYERFKICRGFEPVGKAGNAIGVTTDVPNGILSAVSNNFGVLYYAQNAGTYVITYTVTGYNVSKQVTVNVI